MKDFGLCYYIIGLLCRNKNNLEKHNIYGYFISWLRTYQNIIVRMVQRMDCQHILFKILML
jgi:hypothetical protein